MELKLKYIYLHTKFEVKDLDCVFEVNCEYCNRKIKGEITFWKTGNVAKLIHDGAFHHKDGDKTNNHIDNIILLCWTCHKRLHQLGVILRWLKKIGKTIDSIPNAINLKPMLKKGWY